MADARIIAVGPAEVGLLADLYSQIFSPAQDEEYLRRRTTGRHNTSMFVAMFEDHHVGLSIGYELKPSTFYVWLCGVVPDARRMGVATQLMQAQEAFANEHHYTIVRFECQNHHRPMMHLAITEGYDLVGMRWDTENSGNVAIFEKDIR